MWATRVLWAPGVRVRKLGYPPEFVGRTCEDIISKSLSPSFPRYIFPQELLGRSFHEVWYENQLGVQKSKEAIQLLVNRKYLKERSPPDRYPLAPNVLLRSGR